MTVYVKKKINQKEMEKMFLEASYSGERFVIQREDGVSVGIVPVEDIEVLEAIEV